jgi:hypothetical protein
VQLLSCRITKICERLKLMHCLGLRQNRCLWAAIRGVGSGGASEKGLQVRIHTLHQYSKHIPQANAVICTGGNLWRRKRKDRYNPQMG